MNASVKSELVLALELGLKFESACQPDFNRSHVYRNLFKIDL